jgi:hypothetical protein
MTCRHAVPASQSHRATCRTLFKEMIRLFFGIVGPVALAQFALGFIPECVFATLGPAGHLPQLVGAGADLLNGRDIHLWTHTPYGGLGGIDVAAVRIAFFRRASATRSAGADGGPSVRVGNPICGCARGAFMLFLIRSPLHPASKVARTRITSMRIDG